MNRMSWSRTWQQRHAWHSVRAMCSRSGHGFLATHNALTPAEHLEQWTKTDVGPSERRTERWREDGEAYRPKRESLHLSPHDAGCVRRLGHCGIAKLSMQLHDLVAGKLCILSREFGGIRCSVHGLCYRRNHNTGHDCSVQGGLGELADASADYRPGTCTTTLLERGHTHVRSSQHDI